MNELINKAGEPGSQKRLELIARLNLGKRSDAASRVLIKRARRRELFEIGFTICQANLIINNEQNG